MTRRLLNLTGRFHVVYAAYALLIVIALAAAGATVLTISNYVRAARMIEGLDLELMDLRLVEGESPVAETRLRLHNRSAASAAVESYEFTLRANGEQIGGSYSVLSHDDPIADANGARAARIIDQELPPGGYLDLVSSVRIFRIEMRIVEAARREGPITWTAHAVFLIRLPFSRSEETVGLMAVFGES